MLHVVDGDARLLYPSLHCFAASYLRLQRASAELVEHQRHEAESRVLMVFQLERSPGAGRYGRLCRRPCFPLLRQGSKGFGPVVVLVMILAASPEAHGENNVCVYADVLRYHCLRQLLSQHQLAVRSGDQA